MQPLSTYHSILFALVALVGCGKKEASEKVVAEPSVVKTEVKTDTPAVDSERGALVGRWHGVMTLKGDDLAPKSVPFELKISAVDSEPSMIVNGDNELEITSVSIRDNEVTMAFAAYQTKIVARLSDEKPRTMKGTWSLPWAGGSLDFPFSAVQEERSRFDALPATSDKLDDSAIAAVPSVNGLWEVSYPQPNGSTKLCGARFTQEQDNVQGVFVAPTGDYGHLDGVFQQGKLRLSYFDGAFAYIVTADAQADGTLRGAGQFNLFVQEFTARHLKNSGLDNTLPNCAEITEWAGKESVLSLSFTDLSGKAFALADAGLEGKVVLLDLFGTWCPNCHELVPLLKEWHERYQSTGLEIIGVSFEFADGQSSVSAYRDRYKISYRLLVGASPENAVDVLPQMSLSSFPTLVLVGRDGKIHNIQTGFRGLATGEFREAGAALYENQIKELLAKDAK
jgi:thiol-disulfide isomerase/thioredoxin